MRARAAYISSFGTTGILIAAALLMLAMVSALVAFRAWPGGVTGESVTSVPLAPPDRPVQVSREGARKAPARLAAASEIAPIAREVADRSATAGLVKHVTVRGPAAVAVLTAPREDMAAVRPPPAPPRPPVEQRTADAPAAPPEAPEMPAPPAVPVPNEVEETVDGFVAGDPPPPETAPEQPAPPELGAELGGAATRIAVR